MDVDAALRRMRELPVDPRLAGIEGGVFDGIADARGKPFGGRLVGLAASLALLIGLLGSTIPGYAGPAPSAAPFGTPSALAPSTLLGTVE